MLWILYLFVFIVTVHARTDTWNEVSNSNGWTPVTRERVFSGFDRKAIGQENDEDDYNGNQNNVLQKVIGPRYVHYSASRNRLNGTESKGKKLVLSKAGHRKPKIISSNYSIYAINNLASPNMNEVTDKLDNVPREEFIKDASVSRYEVTETSEVEELIRQRGNFNIQTNSSDQMYKRNATERVNSESTNDFTSKLLSILANYNIRVNDVLPNYELSRNVKRNPPKQDFFFLPIPIRYSSKFNNFNNFAADPMLVVFLSNYRYYLPGQYGLHNRYSNHYGHLSSNNIYNHKPFGPYKIYTDTDSSQ